jgi:hypothetical protein
MTGTATTNGTAPPDAEEAAGVHGSGKAALWAPGTTVAESRYDLYLREVEERRTAMRDDLQELLEAEQHVRDELEDALAASRDREKALVRALSALQDEPAAPAAPTKAKAKAKQQTTPLVSEDKVERVLQALVTLSGDGPRRGCRGWRGGGSSSASTSATRAATSATTGTGGRCTLSGGDRRPSATTSRRGRCGRRRRRRSRTRAITRSRCCRASSRRGTARCRSRSAR